MKTFIDDYYMWLVRIHEKEEDSLNDSNNSEPSVDGESYNKSIAKFRNYHVNMAFTNSL